MIPLPKKADQKKVDKILDEKEKELEEKNKEAKIEHMTYEEQLIEEKRMLKSSLGYKQNYYKFILIIIIFFFCILLEFSCTDLFQNNIIIFLVAFVFLEIILEQILNRLVLDEELLVSPIMGAFVVCQFLMTLGATSFLNFLICYYIDTIIMFIGRIYVDPLVEKLEHLIQRIALYLVSKSQWIESLLRNVLRNELMIQSKLINQIELENYKGEDKGSGFEGLLGSVSSFTNKTQTLIMAPALLIIVKIFATELSITTSNNIRESDLYYYLVFSLIVIIPHLIAYIMLLNSLEIIHGYKIYDYFSYCAYRYSNRAFRYVSENVNMDRSIHNSWRSIDSMNFSSQFFFIISLVSWGMIFILIGFLICLRQSHILLDDPFTVPFIIIGYLLYKCMLLIFRQIVEMLDIFGVKKNILKISTYCAIEHFHREDDLKYKLKNVPAYLQKFVLSNKHWLIQNMTTYLKMNAITSRRLKKIYIDMENLKKSEKLNLDISKKSSIIEEPSNQNVEVEESNSKGTIQNISQIDMGDYEHPNEKINHISFKIMHKKIAQRWLAITRENIYYEELVYDEIAKMDNDCCEDCKKVDNVTRFHIIKIPTLIEKFKYMTLGEKFSSQKWIEFFRKNQKSICLCLPCAIIFHRESKNVEILKTCLNRRKQIIVETIKKPFFKRIISFWRSKATMVSAMK